MSENVAVKSTQERRDILQQTINQYVASGYVVVSQTDTSVQLSRHKKFSWVAAILCLLFFGVGLLLYLVAYAVQADEAAYFVVDEHGNVSQVGAKGEAVPPINTNNRLIGIIVAVVVGLLALLLFAAYMAQRLP